MATRRQQGRKKGPVKFNRRMQSKLAVTFLIIVLLLFGLNIVISKISFQSGDKYTIQVLAQQQYNSSTLPFKRGEITDRNGNVLATSVKVYNLVIDPKVINEKEDYLDPTVTALSNCFKLKREELLKTIAEKKNSHYVVMLKKLEFTEIEEFQKLINDSKHNPDIKGVWFQEEYQRKYPYSTLGCSLLGFTYDGNNADWGIEGYYNETLNGVDGRQYGYVNQENGMEKIIKDPKDGNNIVSTIDIKIQDIVQKKITEYNQEIKAKSISVLIMDPNSGEILAMANDETYDLNKPRDLSGYYSKTELKAMKDKDKVAALNKMWKNECISNTFEPGSTIKPFTVAAALEEGVVTTGSHFRCKGYERVQDRKIKCHKESGHGELSLEDSIVKSCNAALMQVGLKMGSDIFSTYQNRFGFGKKTGIDLMGESSGILYSKENMQKVSLATNSFGQNFTVNMVQVAAGYASLVNGGNYYVPHAVKQVNNAKGGLIENVADTIAKQTVTKNTSDFINKSLRKVVTNGTGTKADIKGYEVGGKTGTAEKLPRGEDQYVLSFIGSVPYDNPEVICYILIDTPQEDPSNSAYATKFFNSVMKEVLPYMNIFKNSDSESKSVKNNNSEESYQSGGYMSGQDIGVIDEEGGYGGVAGTR